MNKKRFFQNGLSIYPGASYAWVFKRIISSRQCFVSGFKGFLALVIVFTLSPVSLAATVLDYIYIESSEGNSSGGHTAIRLGDDVFHYQFVEGNIRLEKQKAVDFEFAYRFLGNRTLHISSVSISEQTYSLLREYFNFQYLAQKQQFTLLNDLLRDRELLLFLRHKTDSSIQPDFRVQGAGLFYSRQDFVQTNLIDFLNPQDTNNGRQSIAIRGLKNDIEDKYGKGFLSQRKTELVEQIRHLQPVAAARRNAASLKLTRDSYPPVVYSFASHYMDLLSELLALDVLDRSRALAPEAYIQANEKVYRLDEKEIESLRFFRDHLHQGLVQLLKSNRPDWGYAVLVNAARLIAVDQSIKSGRLVFVDSFSDNSNWLAPQTLKEFTAEIESHRALALTALVKVKTLLKNAGEFNEFKYSRLELLANRYHELNKGLKQNVPTRFNGEGLVPTKSIPIPDLVYPELPERVLRQAVDQVNAYENQMHAELDRLYAYNLFDRNCVTELFLALEQAFVATKPELNSRETLSVAKYESQRRLGGYVETAPFSFIPFISFYSVKNNYHVGKEQELLSFRLLKLQSMYEQENDLRVFFRESNTLSSTLYKRNAEDSFFVFFTDDMPMLRPLLGAMNILAATGQSLFGLTLAPFDSGDMLKSGAMGVAMSLPELVFFNMRKGTYKYLSFDMQLQAEARMSEL